MTRAIALAVLLLAFAVTFWRPLRHVRGALALAHLSSTGHAFLVLGYLVGLAVPHRHAAWLDELSPLLAFVTGWVGFAAGMRFDLRVLRTIPGRAYASALLPSVVVATTVAVASGAALALLGVGLWRAIATAAVLSAVAASSGPTLVATVRSRRPGRSSTARPVLRMVEFSAGVDDLLVIPLAMLAFALFRTSNEVLAPLSIIAVGLGGGALLGLVAWLLLGGQATSDERLLLGLAMLAFIAGFAGWLQLPPAAVAAIAAMVLVNLPGQRMRQLVAAVRRVERPAVVILMTVIGLQVSGVLTVAALPLVLVLTVVRSAANRWGGELAATDVWAASGLRTAPHWGDGLTPLGILGLLVALSHFQVWGDDLSRSVLAAVAAAGLVNELVAPWLLLRLLRTLDAGSASVRPPRPEGAA